MVQRVHLHIGLPKTATTYLQAGLWRHRDALAERGVLLPGRNHRRHLLASLEFRDDPKLATRPGDVGQPWRDLVEEVGRWRGESAVISHEFFGPANVEQVRRGVDQLAPAEVHVIVTARPMTELAPSRWQEWVKNGGRRPIDRFPRRRDYDPHDAWGWGSFDLADVLSRWSQVVPPERIHVLPTGDPGAGPEEIWERFLDVLEVPGEPLPAPERPVNVRLGLVQVEALRRVNRQLEGFGDAYDRGRWIRGYLASGAVMPEGNEPFRPSAETWDDWVARADRALEMLREGGFDVRGELERLAPQRELPAWRHPSEVSNAELLRVANQMVAAMLTDVRAHNRERHRLEGAIREAATPPPPGPVRRLVRRLRRLLPG